MKRMLLLMLSLFCAVMLYADDAIALDGGWILLIVEPTLLDPGYVGVALSDLSLSSAILVAYIDGGICISVLFDEYLAPKGRHDKSVIYATDMTDGARRISNGWRSGVDTVIWYGEEANALLMDVAHATTIMFRTKDYADNNVDATFTTTPEATTKALFALDEAMHTMNK